MNLLIFFPIIPSILIFIVLSIKIKKNIIWNLLLTLGLSPFVYLSIMAIWVFFFGMDDYFFKLNPGLLSALFTILFYFVIFWYIFIPALGLVIISINKTKKKKLTSQDINKP